VEQVAYERQPLVRVGILTDVDGEREAVHVPAAFQPLLPNSA
jgi:hypothetical protein